MIFILFSTCVGSASNLNFSKKIRIGSKVDWICFLGWIYNFYKFYRFNFEQFFMLFRSNGTNKRNNILKKSQGMLPESASFLDRTVCFLTPEPKPNSTFLFLQQVRHQRSHGCPLLGAEVSYYFYVIKELCLPLTIVILFYLKVVISGLQGEDDNNSSLCRWYRASKETQVGGTATSAGSIGLQAIDRGWNNLVSHRTTLLDSVAEQQLWLFS